LVDNLDREMKSSGTTAADEASSPASISAAAQRQRQAELTSYAESMYFGAAGELAYARGIELTNGRCGMSALLGLGLNSSCCPPCHLATVFVA